MSRKATRSCIATVLLFSATASAQNPAAEAQTHLREANAAYAREDYAAYVLSLEAAHELNPASLATRHNLAGGYALIGENQKSLRLLEGLANVSADFGIAEDPDFETLRSSPEYHTVLARTEAATQSKLASQPYFSMAQLDLIPEGIAADVDGDRLFFGSMRSGDVYELNTEKQLTKFATVDVTNKRSAIGMTVDAARGLLWVVATSFDMAENFAEGDKIQTSVVGFDLKSGAETKRYDVAETRFGLNDVALGPDGTLYASGDALQILDRDADTLVPLMTNPPLFGTNGIAAAGHGRTLFVSSYPVGIAAIDLDSRRARFLETPDEVSLYGVDGLYWLDGDLIAVQNGIRPWRLTRLKLSDDESSVRSAHTLEFAHPDVTPTTGAIVDDHIYYIGGGSAPEQAPAHIPPAVAPFLGATLIRSAPLDP